MLNTIALGIAENPWPLVIALALLAIGYASTCLLERILDPRTLRRRRLKRTTKARKATRKHRARRRSYIAV